jgi:hypothetical protein
MWKCGLGKWGSRFLRFVSANEKAEQKNGVRDAASNKVSATRQEIRRQRNDLQKQSRES